MLSWSLRAAMHFILHKIQIDLLFFPTCFPWDSAVGSGNDEHYLETALCANIRLMCWGSCELLELRASCSPSVHSFHHQCVRTSSALAAQAGCSHQLPPEPLSALDYTSAHCCVVQTLTNCRWMPVYRGIPVPVQTVPA